MKIKLVWIKILEKNHDFSKTNVNSNLGYLVASQANIVQAQSVRLLS